MIKTLLFVFFISCTALGAFAQTKSLPQLSFGADYGLPGGSATGIYGTAIGGSAKLELPVSHSKFNFVLTTGISEYILKFYYSGTAQNATMITPLEVGGKYYFSKIGYVEADFGLAVDRYSEFLPNEPNAVNVTNNGFVYSPGIGFTAPTRKHKAAVDIGLRYETRAESTQTMSQLALRVAYRFGI